jgi:large conductance mechanosensitive channel
MLLDSSITTEVSVGGFKDFLMRGNLIELAVAFIMGTVFAAVVQAFTKIILDVLGLIFNVEGLSVLTAGGVNIGNFVTALITFFLTAFVLYFALVVPYNRLSDLRKKDEPQTPASSEDLLAEIRDLLKAQNDSGR